MGAIAVAPSNNQVIYAGTGEANNSADSNYGVGILKSTNAGSTWVLETDNGVFNGLTTSKIAVDPNNANIVYAAMANVGNNAAFIDGTGVYKSTDGGTTWTNTTSSISTFRSLQRRRHRPIEFEHHLHGRGHHLRRQRQRDLSVDECGHVLEPCL